MIDTQRAGPACTMAYFEKNAKGAARLPTSYEEVVKIMGTRRAFLSKTGAMVAGAALFARPPRVFGQSKMVLKASDVHPLGYPTVEAIVRMGKKLETATGGRLTVQMFPAMQLGGEKEMLEQTQVGALQICRVSVGPGGDHRR